MMSTLVDNALINVKKTDMMLAGSLQNLYFLFQPEMFSHKLVKCHNICETNADKPCK